MNDKLEEWWAARDARLRAAASRRESGAACSAIGSVGSRDELSTEDAAVERDHLRAVVAAIRTECLSTLTSPLVERVEYGEGLRAQATWILEIMDTGHV